MNFKNIIFFTFVISIISFTAHTQSKLVEGVIAIVDEEAILLSDFKQALKRFKSNVPINSSDDNNQIEHKVLELLIMQKLQAKSAKNNAIRVSEHGINSSIEIIAKNNKMTLKQLYNEVKKTGQSIEQYRDSLRNQIIQQRLQQKLFSQNVQISESEIEASYKREQQINDPYEYQIQYLLISAKEDSLQAWDESKIKIQKVKQETQQGLEFKKAISLYSDLNNKVQQQTIDWQNITSLPDSFHKAVFNLKKDQISQPIKTGRGYFLLKLVDKRYKNKSIVAKYQLEQIFLSTSSYDKKSAIQIYQLVKAELSASKTFADFAQQFSQDEHAASGGKTDWINSWEVNPNFASSLANIKPNQLEFVQTNGGWLIYQLLTKQNYDASEKIQKQLIRRKLLIEKVQEKFEDHLKNLRQTSSIRINENLLDHINN